MKSCKNCKYAKHWREYGYDLWDCSRPEDIPDVEEFIEAEEAYAEKCPLYVPYF